MRVLITWGSKRGGTAGIGQIIAEELRERGHEAIAVPSDEAPPLHGFDAVIVGGALYANRWHRGARRFVDRHARALRRVPVWLFSTGAVWPPIADVLALHKPRGAGRIVAFVTGFAQGLLSRVEAETLRFL